MEKEDREPRHCCGTMTRPLYVTTGRLTRLPLSQPGHGTPRSGGARSITRGCPGRGPGDPGTLCVGSAQSREWRRMDGRRKRGSPLRRNSTQGLGQSWAGPGATLANSGREEPPRAGPPGRLLPRRRISVGFSRQRVSSSECLAPAALCSPRPPEGNGVVRPGVHQTPTRVCECSCSSCNFRLCPPRLGLRRGTRPMGGWEGICPLSRHHCPALTWTEAGHACPGRPEVTGHLLPPV